MVEVLPVVAVAAMDELLLVTRLVLAVAELLVAVTGLKVSNDTGVLLAAKVVPTSSRKVPSARGAS